MTAKSLVMKTRPGTTAARLISAWVWLLVIVMLLRSRIVIQRTFMVVIPLLLMHTLSYIIIIITET